MICQNNQLKCKYYTKAIIESKHGVLLHILRFFVKHFCERGNDLFQILLQDIQKYVNSADDCFRGELLVLFFLGFKMTSSGQEKSVDKGEQKT